MRGGEGKGLRTTRRDSLDPTDPRSLGKALRRIGTLRGPAHVPKAKDSIRARFQRIVLNPWFDRVILCLILSNCIFILLEDPLCSGALLNGDDCNPFCEVWHPVDKCSQETGRVAEVAEFVYMVLFTLELLLKVIAFGLWFAEDAYLRDTWNVIDAVIVLVGWLGYLPYIVNLSEARVLRVLRFLRTVKNIPGMRPLIGAFLKSMRPLLDVSLLVILTFVVFGVVGVQLFKGSLHGRCFYIANDSLVDDGICGEGRQCEEGSVCNKTIPGVFPLTYNPNPEAQRGLLSFDNIFEAFLVIFQCTTLEGWTDMMYQLEDGANLVVVRIFFICMIVIGAMFALNICLAVIAECYNASLSLDSEQRAIEAMNQDELLSPMVDAIVHTHKERPKSSPSFSAIVVDENLTNSMTGRHSLQLPSPSAGAGANSARASPRHSGMSPPRSPSTITRARSGTGLKVAIAPSISEHDLDHHLSPLSLISSPQGRFYGSGASPHPDKSPESPPLPVSVTLSEVDNVTAGSTEDGDCGAYRKRAQRAALRIVVSLTFQRLVIFVILLNLLALGVVHFRQPVYEENYKAAFADACSNFTSTASLSDEELFAARRAAIVSLSGYYLNGSMSECGQFAQRGSEQARICVCGQFLQGLSEKNIIYGMIPELVQAIEITNLICIGGFFLEMVLKLVALGPRGYVQDWLNVFDGGLVLGSFVEIILPIAFVGTWSKTVSALRALRLFRIFKIASSWPTLRLILQTLRDSALSLGPLAALLTLFIFIFSLAGMKLFGGKLPEETDMLGVTNVISRDPLNFDSFLPGERGFGAVITIFTILTGENWNDIMYRAMADTSLWAFFYFGLLVVLGIYVVMNLFVAILLQGFVNLTLLDASETKRWGFLKQIKVLTWLQSNNNSLFVFSPTNRCRRFCSWLINLRYFDSIILILIVVSSILMAVEFQDIIANEANPFFQNFNYFFVAVFIVEMLVKMVAQGVLFGETVPIEDFFKQSNPANQFHDARPYLQDGWNIMDFAIVAFSALSISFPAVRGFRALRTIRSLRPLRMIARFQGIKIAVNSIIRAIPPSLNVLLVSLLFLVVFSVMGVIIYAGTFYSCKDSELWDGNLVQFMYVNTTGPDSWTYCVPTPPEDGRSELFKCRVRDWLDCKVGARGEWVLSTVHFNRINGALWLLCELWTLEQWIGMMEVAAHSVGRGQMPVYMAYPLSCLFFVVMVLLFSFFIINMFIVVVIQTYSEIKLETSGETLMSPDQRDWIEAQFEFLHINLKKEKAPPDHPVRYALFRVVTHERFDWLVILVVVVNLVSLAVVNFPQSEEKAFVLGTLSTGYTFFFIVETIAKVIAFAPRAYISNPWNCFDLIIVLLSTVCVFLDFDSATFAVLRTFRGLFTLSKYFAWAKSLRRMLSTLFHSLPSLFNVGFLLVLLLFVYSFFGVVFFHNVANQEFISEHAHFRTFMTAMITLFRMTTGENWNGLMHDCMSGICVTDDINDGCGGPFVTFTYFASFFMIATYILLNLFIAVVLDNFSASDPTAPLAHENIQRFRVLWKDFDPKAKQHIHASRLEEFLLALGPPLGIASDASRAEIGLFLFRLPIPLDHESHVWCMDIFIALASNALALPCSFPLPEQPRTQELLRAIKHSNRVSLVARETYKETRGRRTSTSANLDDEDNSIMTAGSFSLSRKMSSFFSASSLSLGGGSGVPPASAASTAGKTPVASRVPSTESGLSVAEPVVLQLPKNRGGKTCTGRQPSPQVSPRSARSVSASPVPKGAPAHSGAHLPGSGPGRSPGSSPTGATRAATGRSPGSTPPSAALSNRRSPGNTPTTALASGRSPASTPPSAALASGRSPGSTPPSAVLRKGRTSRPPLYITRAEPGSAATSDAVTTTAATTRAPATDTATTTAATPAAATEGSAVAADGDGSSDVAGTVASEGVAGDRLSRVLRKRSSNTLLPPGVRGAEPSPSPDTAPPVIARPVLRVDTSQPADDGGDDYRGEGDDVVMDLPPKPLRSPTNRSPSPSPVPTPNTGASESELKKGLSKAARRIRRVSQWKGEDITPSFLYNEYYAAVRIQRVHRQRQLAAALVRDGIAGGVADAPASSVLPQPQDACVSVAVPSSSASSALGPSTSIPEEATAVDSSDEGVCLAYPRASPKLPPHAPLESDSPPRKQLETAPSMPSLPPLPPVPTPPRLPNTLSPHSSRPFDDDDADGVHGVILPSTPLQTTVPDDDNDDDDNDDDDEDSSLSTSPASTRSSKTHHHHRHHHRDSAPTTPRPPSPPPVPDFTQLDGLLDVSSSVPITPSTPDVRPSVRQLLAVTFDAAAAHEEPAPAHARDAVGAEAAATAAVDETAATTAAAAAAAIARAAQSSEPAGGEAAAISEAAATAAPVIASETAATGAPAAAPTTITSETAAPAATAATATATTDAAVPATSWPLSAAPTAAVGGSRAGDARVASPSVDGEVDDELTDSSVEA